VNEQANAGRDVRMYEEAGDTVLLLRRRHGFNVQLSATFACGFRAVGVERFGMDRKRG